MKEDRIYLTYLLYRNIIDEWTKSEYWRNSMSEYERISRDKLLDIIDFQYEQIKSVKYINLLIKECINNKHYDDIERLTSDLEIVLSAKSTNDFANIIIARDSCEVFSQWREITYW